MSHLLSVMKILLHNFAFVYSKANSKLHCTNQPLHQFSNNYHFCHRAFATYRLPNCVPQPVKMAFTIPESFPAHHEVFHQQIF